MSAAATTSPETLHPDPHQAVPPRIGQVLGLLRTLVAYGKNLADTLRQHAADPQVLPCFTFLTMSFGANDLAQILARITRGLLRAAALEQRLRRCAARGHDLEQQPADSLPPSPRKPRPRGLVGRPHDPARDPSLTSPPTLAQIAARDRRRPIGAILVDICLDLGIVPDQMDRATWEELRHDVRLYGGNFAALLFRREGNPRSRLSAATLSPIPIAGQPAIAFPPWPPPPLGAADWDRGPGP